MGKSNVKVPLKTLLNVVIEDLIYKKYKNGMNWIQTGKDTMHVDCMRGMQFDIQLIQKVKYLALCIDGERVVGVRVQDHGDVINAVSDHISRVKESWSAKDKGQLISGFTIPQLVKKLVEAKRKDGLTWTATGPKGVVVSDGDSHLGLNFEYDKKGISVSINDEEQHYFIRHDFQPLLEMISEMFEGSYLDGKEEEDDDDEDDGTDEDFDSGFMATAVKFERHTWIVADPKMQVFLDAGEGNGQYDGPILTKSIMGATRYTSEAAARLFFMTGKKRTPAEDFVGGDAEERREGRKIGKFAQTCEVFHIKETLEVVS